MAADFAAGSRSCGRLRRTTRPRTSCGSRTRRRRASPCSRAAGGWKQRAAGAYLSVRRRGGGCLMICGWEGEPEAVRRRRSLARRRLRAGGAVSLGGAAGRSWEKGRYEGPYLRDELLGLGVFVETLETSHTWAKLHEALRRGRWGPEAGARAEVDRLLPRLARLPRRRLALLHVPLPRQARRRDRAMARCEDRGLRGDRRHGRHDHAPPRRRPRPRALHARGGRRPRDQGPARRQGRLDPAGIMNPGKLLP